MSDFVGFLREEARNASTGGYLAESKQLDKCADELKRLRDVAKRREAKLDRLQAIVEKLPNTADGVRVVPGMTVWCNGTMQYDNEALLDMRASKQRVVMDIEGGFFMGQSYSTQAAAQAALAKPEGIS